MDTTIIIISILFVSLLFNIPLSKFKVPPIIGYIITGVLVRKKRLNKKVEL